MHDQIVRVLKKFKKEFGVRDLIAKVTSVNSNISDGYIRNTLCRLVKSGLVKNTGWGKYQVVGNVEAVVSQKASKAGQAASKKATEATGKRGRPRKVEAAAPKKRGRPRKEEQQDVAPKKRGRPKKVVEVVPKRRGRPKKEAVPVQVEQQSEGSNSEQDDRQLSMF